MKGSKMKFSVSALEEPSVKVGGKSKMLNPGNDTPLYSTVIAVHSYMQLKNTAS
jgi:hypothetical protein